MKAIVYHDYGAPEVLQVEEVEKPVPKDNEVLVKVYATTVTSGDIKSRSSNFFPVPWLIGRMMTGFTKPKRSVLGMEFSGVIESTGKNITRFKAGDQVFGTTTGLKFGSYAEYICMPEIPSSKNALSNNVLTIKPANCTYEEAATFPVAGLTALVFLRDMAKIRSGHKILINGASGSVGACSIQLAKYYGAEATGVCSSANMELVKSLGADKAIDYSKEDFTKNGETYDIILDAVSFSSFSRCKKSLKQKGIYLATAPTMATIFQMIGTSIVGGKKVMFGGAAENIDDLIILREIIEEGKIKAVIDRVYPLEQIIEAHRYVDQGHKKGNVVITVAQDGK